MCRGLVKDVIKGRTEGRLGRGEGVLGCGTSFPSSFVGDALILISTNQKNALILKHILDTYSSDSG